MVTLLDLELFDSLLFFAFVMVTQYILFVSFHLVLVYGSPFFGDSSDLLQDIHTNQMNYGVSVSDVDDDGTFEWVVGGFQGPNLVLKLIQNGSYLLLNHENNSQYQAIRDFKGNTLGVAACDIDGDGREELYFVNANFAYGGAALYRHSLFKYRNGHYVNLFDDQVNLKSRISVSARSVACVDRKGNGLYSFVVATYAMKGMGKFVLIEMDSSHPENDVNAGNIVLKNAAKEAGIERSTGGRSVLVGPILGNGGLQDILLLNEGNSISENPGANQLFMNRGDGTFVDVAKDYGILDAKAEPRGAILEDLDRDGWLDIAYIDYMSGTKIFLRSYNTGFEDVTDTIPDLQEHWPGRSLLAADFDNDGHLELFFHMMVDPVPPSENRVFRLKSNIKGDLTVEELNPGPAIEPDGYGTGGCTADINKDGILQMLLTHGEDLVQPITMYQPTPSTYASNRWIRIAPLTQFGAPARGALVNVTLSDGGFVLKVVDGGSCYLGQNEPVAHFGLGRKWATNLKVVWPGGRAINHKLEKNDVNRLHVVRHPEFQELVDHGYSHSEL